MSAAPIVGDPFVIRPAGDGDLNFVRSSWLREYAYSQTARRIGDLYWDYHHMLVEALLARAHVVVAGLKDKPDTICGWACTEPGRVHFVCVKPRWRRLGLARRLLAPFASITATYTHRTATCALVPIPSTWTYNPKEAFPCRS